MSQDIRFERLLGSTPERVFNAFTSPVGQREFYGRDEPGWIVKSRCDLRVGGVWSVTFGPSPDELYHRHIFEVIERPRRLRMASTETRADGLNFDFTTELTFEPRGDRTLMTMTQTGFPNEMLRDEHTVGLPHAYDRIERLLRGGPLPLNPAVGSDSRFPTEELETRMGATVLYMSISLDGFVAGPNEGPDNPLGDDGHRLHAWFPTGIENGSGRSRHPSEAVNGQIFDEMLATGAVVAGAGTFEPAGGWSGDHHDGVPIFIYSRHAPRIDISGWPLVTYVNDVETAMTRAKEAAGEKDVLVHGAAVTQLAIAAGVLDELELHVVPVLLGQGRGLFDHLDPQHIELERLRILEGEHGVTHLRYRVSHPRGA